jgi:hypothetical protein
MRLRTTHDDRRGLFRFGYVLARSRRCRALRREIRNVGMALLLHISSLPVLIACPRNTPPARPQSCGRNTARVVPLECTR